jgi:hypothetical protein
MKFLYVHMEILSRRKEKKEEIAEADASVCIQCRSRPAEIFQVTGDYCLECWQTITHTNA